MSKQQEAMRLALEALEYGGLLKKRQAITALKAALAENDKRMEWYRERKANWDLQRKLVSETEERDRQRREYEEERLAALAEPATLDEAMAGPMAPAQAYENGWNAAKAEPVEPVAWWHRKSDTFTSGSLVANFKEWTPLYPAPPQRKPLTNGDIMTMWPESVLALTALEFARAIERAHGIKP